MNQPRTYPEGITCWVDIEATDVEEAARFYGVLFDWTSSRRSRSLATSLLDSTVEY